MEKFDADATQIAWLIQIHIDRLTVLWGGYAQWIRAVGRPINNTLLPDDIIWELADGAVEHWPKVRALYAWAGLAPPLRMPPGGKMTNNTIIVPIGGWETLALHVFSLQQAYERPDYW